MNNQSAQPGNGVFSTRTLVNFPHLSEESVSLLIETLGFKMGLTELRFCQNYFKSTKAENPTIHELKIIDRAFFDNAQNPKSRAIASFSTNDKLVADTYADLMAKRRSVNPDYSAPCSLNEILAILPAFYKGTQKQGLSGIRLFSGQYRKLKAAAALYKTIAESEDCSAAIALKMPTAKNRIEVGDTLYAVLKSFNDSDDFESRLLSLLQSSEMVASAKETFILENVGVCTALSEFNFGVKLNVKSFEGKDGCVSPFEHFAESDFGSISVLNKSKAADMLITAQNLGLRVVELGQLSNNELIQGVSRSGESLSINQKLLRSVAFSTIVSAEADEEAPNIAEKVESLYIAVDGKRNRMNSVVCSGENYFMAGFNTVVHAYALCAVSGATEIIGNGVYTLPLKNPTAKDIGRSLELILGAYKAQQELGIYDVCPKIIIGDSPSLSFHALSDAPLAPPSKTALAGSSIRYCEPTKNENGLPDVKNIKKMYEYMNRLTQELKISAILPSTADINASLDRIIDSPTAVRHIPNGLKSNYGCVLFSTAAATLEIGGEIASIPTSVSFADEASHEAQNTKFAQDP